MVMYKRLKKEGFVTTQELTEKGLVVKRQKIKSKPAKGFMPFVPEIDVLPFMKKKMKYEKAPTNKATRARHAWLFEEAI